MSLKLSEGEVLALVGKSGGGKTTLLKCIYGLEDLAEGTIALNGRKVLGPSWNLLPGDPDMKLVSQEFYVLENHTVLENVRDRLQGLPESEKQKRSSRVLKLLELDKLKDMPARVLSSGQRQRVAIARALAFLPKVLLLDEPFSNLDKLLAGKLFAFIIREAKRGKTSVVLVTHLAEEALKYADTIAIMHEGRILQYGDKWKVYYKPKNLRLAGLLGDFNVLRREDLDDVSKAGGKPKLFLRPDQIIPNGTKHADLRLGVIGCSFNGKCYEVIGETATGRTVMVYSAEALDADRQYGFRIES